MLLGQEVVDKISEMEFSGDVIPKEWKHAIVTKEGNADTVALIVYARIVYWCRPGKDGKKKFEGDWVHISYDDFRKQCNLSEKQVRDAVKRLEAMGLIHTLHSYEGPGGERGNYKYYIVDPEKLEAINTGGFVAETSGPKVVDKCVDEGHTSLPHGQEGGTPEGHTSLPHGQEGGALEDRTKTKRKKEKQKERKAVGNCPLCGEMLFELHNRDGRVFFGHLDGHKPSANCTKTFSTIAEIRGYEENPTSIDTCVIEMPDDVMRKAEKLLMKMSIDEKER